MNQNITFNVSATTAQAEQSLTAVYNGIEKVRESVKSISSLRQGIGSSVRGEELFPAYRESITTIDNLRARLTMLNQVLNSSDTKGAVFANTAKEIVLVEQALSDASASAKKYAMAINSVGETQRRGAMVGLSFNRIVQDAGYFGQSAAMGFLAVGNNITFFAEQLSYAKQQGLKMTEVLKGMLTGVNAWMFGINLAVSAITFFTMSQRSSKSATDQNTDSIKEQKKALEALAESEKEWERKAKDIGLLMRNLNKGRLDELKTEEMALRLNIRLIQDRVKAAKNLNPVSKEAIAASQEALLLPSLQRRLSTVIDELMLMDAQFRNIPEPASKMKEAIQSILSPAEELNEVLKDLFSSAHNKLIKDQADELFRIVEVWSKMPKFGEGDSKLILPRTISTNFAKPDTAGYLGDYFARKDKEEINLYKSTLREFSSVGSNLRTIFGDAGDSFLGKMLETLQVVTSIAEIIQSISEIKTFLTTLSLFSPASSFLGPLIPGIGGRIPVGVGPSPNMIGDFSHTPTQHIISLRFEGTERAQIVASGYKQAIRLRYLH